MKDVFWINLPEAENIPVWIKRCTVFEQPMHECTFTFSNLPWVTGIQAAVEYVNVCFTYTVEMKVPVACNSTCSDYRI